MLDLVNQRNTDFMDACRHIITQLPASRPIVVREVTSRAALSRPPRHYLSFPYALRRLRAYRRRLGASPAEAAVLTDRARDQWADLSARVLRLQLRYGLTDRDALQRELTDGAPASFFMTPIYAERLYQRLRRNRNNRH